MDDFHGQIISVKDAGGKGGMTTLARYGSEYFRAIGRKGQASLARKATSEQRRAWGALGGRPRRLKPQHMGEKGQLIR